jgi:hypothetical protein
MEINSKKIQRKLKFLCSKQSPHKIDDYTTYLKLTEQFKTLEPHNTICKIFMELKYSITDANIFWVKTYKEYNKNKIDYTTSPKIERKDNKYVMVGSGRSNKNTIRYPSKKRKTAWKRFYKLFPFLNPKNIQ